MLRYRQARGSFQFWAYVGGIAKAKQSPFRIGIDSFPLWPLPPAITHVTRPHGPASGHVLSAEPECRLRRRGMIFLPGRRQTAQSTAAAPPMSPFIWNILAAGLRQIPPESKVMPLPIRISGFFLVVAGRRMLQQAGAPFARTLANGQEYSPALPQAARRGRLLQVKPASLAISSAMSARASVLSKFAGILHRSRQWQTVSADSSPPRGLGHAVWDFTLKTDCKPGQDP